MNDAPLRTVGDIIDDLPAPIGHNQPPEPSPLEQHTSAINSLYMEAGNWLDGTAIENQGQADEVTRLKDSAKKLRDETDAKRVELKKPHDDAAAAVQKVWKPLVDKAEKVEKVSKGLLGGWLLKEQARQREAAEAARKLADETARLAREQHEAAQRAGNLAALEEAEERLQDAKVFDKAARAADREKPIAKVEGMGRGVGLTTVWDVAIIETGDVEQPRRASEQQLAKFFWENDRQRVVDFYLSLAREKVKAGARSIPGVNITSRQVAR